MTTTPPAGPYARRTGSHTSLTHLTLAPLSTGRPLVDNTDYDEPASSIHTYASSPPHRRTSLEQTGDDEFVSPAPTAPLQWHHHRLLSGAGPYASHGSYVSSKSTPTTPGILSRSHSPTRLGLKSPNGMGTSKSFTHLAFGPASGATTPEAVPKSAGFLEAGKIGTRGSSKRTKERARLKKSRESSEWLYRHGTALSGEARESKGQSWFVSRASSTSLTATTNAMDEVRRSRSFNRNLRTSRRGSKIGSRPDLKTFGATSALSTRSSGTAMVSEGGDYFSHGDGASRFVDGPDFVDKEEEEEDDTHGVEYEEVEREMDDIEVARLARENSGFGLGTLVDKVIGWSLFEPGESAKGDEEEEELKNEQMSRLKRVRDSQKELSRLARAERKVMNEKEAKAKGSVDREEGTGWNDAAWLLSVASKVLF